MAFADNEHSPQSGRPVYFLKVKRGIKEWYYTNADQSMTFDGHLYLANPLEIPDILQNGDAKSEEVTIGIPASTALCEYLDTSGPQSQGYTIFLRKAHVRESEIDGSFTAPTLAEAPIFWIGELMMIRRPSIIQRTLVCNTLALSMQRTGLRLTWGRTCPHMLYQRGCLVNREDFRVDVAGIVVAGPLEITVAEAGAYAPNWFSGGYVEWESEPDVIETRGIEIHNGTSLTIFGNTRGMAGGSNYSLFPGCDRLASTCNTKFSNLPNYGGINHLQGKSPFDGRQVF